MASTLNKLTGMGGDVRKIAALLQKKAPPGHRLAYINEEEAALLKSRGGSGKPQPDTGIPSYELDDSLAAGGAQGYGGDTSYQTPVDTAAGTAPATSYSDFGAGTGVSAGLPFATGGQTVTAPPTSGSAREDVALSSFPEQVSTPDAARLQAAGGKQLAELTGAPAKEEGLADQLSKGTGLSKDSLGRLGLAGLTGLLGSRATSKAAQAGQAGAQQMKALAAPYQQQGAQLQAQAQRGELTPVGQQSLKALQAQAAQGVEKRGGVGVMQAQQQVESFRQQLLAQQYDYGLKLSGIGDNIALGAIRTGLQADQFVNQLTNQYYTNIARTAFGAAPQVAGAPATTTAG